MKHNCPVVSRDFFREHVDDCKLAPEVREWIKTAASLQVRWSWAQGEFLLDFDLSPPLLRPSRGQLWTQRAVGASGLCVEERAANTCTDERSRKISCEGYDAERHENRFYCGEACHVGKWRWWHGYKFTCIRCFDPLAAGQLRRAHGLGVVKPG